MRTIARHVIHRWLAGALVLIISLACTCAANAHELTQGVGTQTFCVFKKGYIEIELNFGVSASAGWGYLSRIDTDRDGRVDNPEIKEFLRAQAAFLAPDLDVRINGRRVQLELVRYWHVGMVGRVAPIPFDCYFLFTAKLPPAIPPSGWWLQLHDGTYAKDVSSQSCWVRDHGHHEDVSWRIATLHTPEEIPGAGLRVVGRDLTVLFDNAFNPEMTAAELHPPTLEKLAAIDLGAEWDAAALLKKFSEQPILAGGREPEYADPFAKAPGDNTAAAVPPPTPSRAAAEDKEISKLEEILVFLRGGSWPLASLIPYILLAIVLGAGHALGPGHGKSMVSAYLVGSQGRVRDAVVLGLVVTFSHTISIFILGLGLSWAMAQTTESAASETYKNWLITSVSMLSGLLLATLGLTLAITRWKNRQELAAGHEHPPLLPAAAGAAQGGAGEAAAKTIGPRFRDLITLGVSGGIVPCPAGLTIMLIAVHLQALTAALVLFFFFSLGLGGLLVGIGVAIVLGREGAFAFSKMKKERRDRFIANLSIISAFLIACLGLFFTAESIYKDPTSFVQMATALKEWWAS